jgi:hypothetical protein
MLQLLIIILFFSYVTSNNLQIQKFRNNWIRVYINSYNKEKQRISINTFCLKLYNKFYENLNIYFIKLNNDYYTLPDDERTIIETLVSLIY